MSPDYVRRSPLHGRQIKRPCAVPDKGSQCRRAHGFGGDAILVRLSARAVTGMKFCRDGFYRKDADIRGQKMVQGALQIRAWNGGIKGKRHNLPECVDPGIGAAGPLGKDGLPGDVAQGLSKGALNRRKCRLNLPAMIGSAVVSNSEFPVGHGTEEGGTWGPQRSGFHDL